MAYDLKLADRIRVQLEGLPFVEKKMFGGVGFLIDGIVTCGVYKDDLIVRVDPEKSNQLRKKLHVKPFDISGKPMKGWLLVEPGGVQTDKRLSTWIREGIEFAATLPPK